MGRINRSVKLLDKHYGKKWPFDVKLKKLDIIDGRFCVLGQLYGSYSKADDMLSKKGRNIVGNERFAFESQWPESGFELTEKWRKRIKKLRKERKK